MLRMNSFKHPPHAGLMFGKNSNSVVLHPKANLIPALLGPNAYLEGPIPGGKLDRVIDKIGDGLSEERLVTEHRQQGRFDGDAGILQMNGRILADDIRNKLVQGDGMQLKVGARNLAVDQDIAGEAVHPMAGAGDALMVDAAGNFVIDLARED